MLQGENHTTPKLYVFGTKTGEAKRSIRFEQKDAVVCIRFLEAKCGEKSGPPNQLGADQRIVDEADQGWACAHVFHRAKAMSNDVADLAT